jgi:Ethanolamine utilization protein EutJ (predicted chaperonin)
MNATEMQIEEVVEETNVTVEMIELTVEQLCDVGGGTTYVLY